MNGVSLICVVVVVVVVLKNVLKLTWKELFEVVSGN